MDEEGGELEGSPSSSGARLPHARQAPSTSRPLASTGMSSRLADRATTVATKTTADTRASGGGSMAFAPELDVLSMGHGASEVEATPPPAPKGAVEPLVAIGNESAWAKVQIWFHVAINKTPPSAPLVVQGPCGVGKTFTIESLAKMYNMDIHELGTMDRRTPDAMRSGVKECRGKSIHGNRMMLFVDDLELCEEEAIDAFVEAVRSTPRGTLPIVVCTCQDYWSMNIRAMHAIVPATSITLLGPITEKEMMKAAGVNMNDATNIRLAGECNGDYRQFLIRLRGDNSRVDRRINNMFDKTRALMGSSSNVVARHSLLESDPFILSSMLHENYPEAIGTDNMHTFIDSLSIADAHSRFSEFDAASSFVLSNSIRTSGNARACSRFTTLPRHIQSTRSIPDRLKIVSSLVRSETVSNKWLATDVPTALIENACDTMEEGRRALAALKGNGPLVGARSKSPGASRGSATGRGSSGSSSRGRGTQPSSSRDRPSDGRFGKAAGHGAEQSAWGQGSRDRERHSLTKRKR